MFTHIINYSITYYNLTNDHNIIFKFFAQLRKNECKVILDDIKLMIANIHSHTTYHNTYKCNIITHGHGHKNKANAVWIDGLSINKVYNTNLNDNNILYVDYNYVRPIIDHVMDIITNNTFYIRCNAYIKSSPYKNEVYKTLHELGLNVRDKSDITTNVIFYMLYSLLSRLHDTINYKKQDHEFVYTISNIFVHTLNHIMFTISDECDIYSLIADEVRGWQRENMELKAALETKVAEASAKARAEAKAEAKAEAEAEADIRVAEASTKARREAKAEAEAEADIRVAEASTKARAEAEAEANAKIKMLEQLLEQERRRNKALDA